MDYKKSLLVRDKTKSLSHLSKFNGVNFDHNIKKKQYLNCRLENTKLITNDEQIKRGVTKTANIDGSVYEME